MKKILFIFLFALVFFIQAAFACSLAGKSLKDFDEKEYIFIGEVIGYTQPVKSESLQSEAVGLVVKIKESVYLPKTPKTHFEIFPIQLWADCSEGGMPLEQLKKKFTIGSEIRVIAKESEILPNNLHDGNIRLEDRPNELGSITLNTDNKGKRLASVNSVFDYKSFRYDIDENTESEYLLPNFEIRKDLFRLKNSQQNERKEILNRLQNVPVCCNDLDFYSLFKKYSSSENEFNSLYDLRLRKELTKDEFKQYKIVEEVQTELIKLGYKDKEAEEAVGKAIQEGTEVSKQKLLARSLQILQKKNPK